jgi:hypothetical protein
MISIRADEPQLSDTREFIGAASGRDRVFALRWSRHRLPDRSGSSSFAEQFARFRKQPRCSVQRSGTL